MKRTTLFTGSFLMLGILTLTGCGTPSANPNVPKSGSKSEINNATPNHSVNQQSALTKKQILTSPVSEHSYPSTAEATGAITSLEHSFGQFYPSGPPVNLGLGIKAEFSGGAGQYSYKWNEGRWIVLTRFWGPAGNGAQMAKEVVSYLHTHMLPVPVYNGVIMISQPSSSTTPKVSQNTIAWQVGSKTYKLQQTGNPIKSLETVVNNKNGK
ncbi:MAG: hypothetical protein ACYCYO_22570 [Bacilli bacterium]